MAESLMSMSAQCAEVRTAEWVNGSPSGFKHCWGLSGETVYLHTLGKWWRGVSRGILCCL